MYPYVKQINIDLEDCTNCQTCVNSCFIDVLRWDEAKKNPIVAYPEDCVGCLFCEANCPQHCIEIVPIIPLQIPSPY